MRKNLYISFQAIDFYNGEFICRYFYINICTMPYMTKRIQFDIKANARQCGLESCLSCKTNIHTYAGRNILRQHLFPIITRLITI